MNPNRRGAPPRSFEPLRYKQEKGKCATGKLRYPTAIDAGIALGRARTGRPVKGADAKVETRHYFCHACAGHHLTSR